MVKANKLKRKSIRFRIPKHHNLMLSWKEAVISNHQNITTLVQYAIQSFVEQGALIDVGKVVVSEHNEASSIACNIQCTAQVLNWFDLLEDNGISPTKAVEAVLENSITVVTDKSEEHIPSENEILLNILRKYTEKNQNETISEKAGEEVEVTKKHYVSEEAKTSMNVLQAAGLGLRH